MRKKIVLITVEGGLDLNKGGPTKVIFELIKASLKNSSRKYDYIGIFSRRFIEISDEKNYNYQFIFDESIQNKRVSAIRKFLRNIQELYLIVSSIRFLINFYRNCFKKRKEIVLVNAHDVTAGFLYLIFFKKIFKKPLILSIHSKGSWSKRECKVSWFFKKLLLLIEKTAIKKADLVTTPSYGAFMHLNEDLKLVDINKKLKVIHNGIEVEANYSIEIKDIDIRFEQLIRQNKKIMLSVPSALVKEKGVDILFKAYDSLCEDIKRELKLVIVGDGPEKGNFENLIRKNKIIIFPKLPRKIILYFMANSTFFVLPHRISIFDYVLLEAMVMRLAIITTPVGGNLEIFTEKDTVVFVPPNDVKILAEKIIFLLNNDEYRKKIAQNAFELVKKNFSLERMFFNYEKTYNLALRYFNKK
ncbi:MAG: glycosyltransferase family 4 protein [Candidatus Aenigmarchaeota archaeon]|nr:glycosyltransferase family 4 protein [Candidatus Aenigmarchaeota archaeon]MDW8149022.1 glycosyltransferase family 4 protein [Candidatus Aenigmarchaeota archaeon]